MSATIYIKTPQCIQITNHIVTLGDFMTIYCSDHNMKDHIMKEPFYQFEKGKQGQLVVSILKVIEFITEKYPDVEISNLGEGDFILSYAPPTKHKKTKELCFTIFICFVSFFGGGYAIMAYNTDVGAKELFTNLSMLFTGNPQMGVVWIVISYAIGLTFGMILFFNHFGNQKIDSDPTPLEVQMRLYENDISTTIIKDVSRRKESMDVK